MTNSRFIADLHVTVLAAPARSAETQAVGTDTVHQALGIALDLDIASTAGEAGATEALTESTQAVTRAGLRAGVLGDHRAVWPRATLHAEATAHVAHTHVAAVLGASRVGHQRGALAALTTIARQTQALSLYANTIAAARRGTLAAHVLRAVNAHEAGEALALVQHTSALAVDAAVLALLGLLAELASATGVAEALVVIAVTLTAAVYLLELGATLVRYRVLHNYKTVQHIRLDCMAR